MPAIYNRGNTQTGSAANTIHQFSLEISDFEAIGFVFKIVEGTNFVSENATIEGSLDNVTWHQIDTKGLGTAAFATLFYSYLSTIPALAFRYIRITVPALGVSKTSRVVWSGRQKHFTTS
jgi:hypothetical protein